MKYIVKSIAVSGLNNHVFTHGTEVTEKQFPVGHAELLLEKGHLELSKDALKKFKAEQVKAVKDATADLTDKKNTYLDLQSDFEKLEAPVKTLDQCQVDIDNTQKQIDEAIKTITLAENKLEEVTTAFNSADEAKKAEAKVDVDKATEDLDKSNETLKGFEDGLKEAAELLTSVTTQTKAYTDLQREVAAAEIEFNKANAYLAKLTK